MNSNQITLCKTQLIAGHLEKKRDLMIKLASQQIQYIISQILDLIEPLQWVLEIGNFYHRQKTVPTLLLVLIQFALALIIMYYTEKDS